MFVVRLNLLRIIDINTSKMIHEEFFDYEIKKIIQVNDQIYVISKKNENVLYLINDSLESILLE